MPLLPAPATGNNEFNWSCLRGSKGCKRTPLWLQIIIIIHKLQLIAMPALLGNSLHNHQQGLFQCTNLVSCKYFANVWQLS